MNPDTVLIGPSGLAAEVDLPAGASGVALLTAIEPGAGAQERALARALRERGVGTVSVGLLNAAERRNRANVYNVALLSHRVFQAMDWVRRQAELRPLGLGLFGAGTAATAALVCAAERPQAVRALAVRSGRPELALESLDRVRAPTLLVVGNVDRDVLQLNYDAYRQLRCDKRLEVVPGAGCDFEDAAACQAAATMLAEWFRRHLVAPAQGAPEGTPREVTAAG